MTAPIRVAVTGAGGQIGYALIFRIASGGLFGPDQPVALQLLEITPALPSLAGDADGAGGLRFPLLADVVATDQATTAFEGADWVILVGGLPRKEGMTPRRPDPGQRADLHRPGQGDQRRGRARRPGPDRRQPVQHQRPDRPLARRRRSRPSAGSR